MFNINGSTGDITTFNNASLYNGVDIVSLNNTINNYIYNNNITITTTLLECDNGIDKKVTLSPTQLLFQTYLMDTYIDKFKIDYIGNITTTGNIITTGNITTTSINNININNFAVKDTTGMTNIDYINTTKIWIDNGTFGILWQNYGSQIYDDGDLNIITDDHMYFRIGDIIKLSIVDSDTYIYIII
jgi:hypothetical protein